MFWLTALVGLPVLNVALLFAAPSVEQTFLVPEMALGAFGELALLIVLAWKYRIGAFEVVGATSGTAAITVLGVVLVFFWRSRSRRGGTPVVEPRRHSRF